MTIRRWIGRRDVARNLFNWMTSFGWFGVFPGTALFVTLIVLIARISGGERLR